jgi:hypothetical protein
VRLQEWQDNGHCLSAVRRDRTEGNGQGESDGGKGCDVHRRDAEGGGADACFGDSGIGQDGTELDW